MYYIKKFWLWYFYFNVIFLSDGAKPCDWLVIPHKNTEFTDAVGTF